MLSFAVALLPTRAPTRTRTVSELASPLPPRQRGTVSARRALPRRRGALVPGPGRPRGGRGRRLRCPPPRGWRAVGSIRRAPARARTGVLRRAPLLATGSGSGSGRADGPAKGTGSGLGSGSRAGPRLLVRCRACQAAAIATGCGSRVTNGSGTWTGCSGAAPLPSAVAGRPRRRRGTGAGSGTSLARRRRLAFASWRAVAASVRRATRSSARRRCSSMLTSSRSSRCPDRMSRVPTTAKAAATRRHTKTIVTRADLAKRTRGIARKRALGVSLNDQALRYREGCASFVAGWVSANGGDEGVGSAARGPPVSGNWA